MTVLLLVGLSVGLAVAAPGPLARADWPYRSPRLGMLAWQAIAVTVVVSAAAAALLAMMPWHSSSDAVCGVWRLCADALGGAHGAVPAVVAWAALVLTVAGLVRFAAAGVPLVRLVRQRHRYASMVRLVGRRRPDMTATILEYPDPAVYLVPGGHGEVVVTSGALSRLDIDELAAVLAHERAHARGRHHLPLALTRLLHQAFPTVAMFGQAHRQIGRLVEMSADDYACRAHCPLVLARALVTLAVCAAPPGALAADGGGDAVERVNRLMSPPRPLTQPVRAVAAVALLALPLTPMMVLLAVPIIPLLRIGLPGS